MLPQGYMEEKKHSPTRTAAKHLIILCAHYWLCFHRKAAIWNTVFLHPFSFLSHMNSSELPVTRTGKPILAKYQKAPTLLMKVLKHTLVFETSNSHIKCTYSESEKKGHIHFSTNLYTISLFKCTPSQNNIIQLIDLQISKKDDISNT